jgi:hypothetical protein
MIHLDLHLGFVSVSLLQLTTSSFVGVGIEPRALLIYKNGHYQQALWITLG